MEEIKKLKNFISLKKNLLTLITITLSLVNLLFLAHFFILSFHNPIVSDDYCFLAILNKHGFWGSLDYWYNNWQGRFMPQLLTNLIVLFYKKTGSTFPLFVLHFSLFFYASYSIIKNTLAGFKMSSRLDKLFIYNLIVLLFAIIYFTTFELGTFYWTTVSTMYFGGVIFTLLGISIILSPKTSILSYLLLIFSFIYAGSSSEHYSILLSLSFFLILLYKIKVHGLRTIHLNPKHKKLLISSLICLIACFLMIFAPGNDSRRSLFPEPDIIKSFYISLKSSWIIVNLLASKLSYFLFLCLPFSIFGFLYKKSGLEKEFLIIASLVVFLITPLIYISTLPVSYATSSLGPLRAMVFITFYLSIFCAVVSFGIGRYVSISKDLLYFLGFIGVGFYLFVMVKSIRTNLVDSIEYSKSLRSTELFLLEEQSKGSTGIIELLNPVPGQHNILNVHPISSNPDNWFNNCICDGLKLDFKIKGNQIEPK